MCGCLQSVFSFQLEESRPLIQHTTSVVLAAVQPDPDGLALEEERRVHQFLTDGCGCSFSRAGCSQRYTPGYYLDIRGQCQELTHLELDMAILGQLMAIVNTSEQTVHASKHRHTPEARKRSRATFFHQGERVCRRTFCFIHSISKKRLEHLKSSLLTNGLTPRVHGNTRRMPHNALSLNDTQEAVQFILNYAEANAILLPGRIPGYKRSDVQLLPACTTRREVWRQYADSVERSPAVHRSIAYSTFCSVWKRFLPQVLVTKPMSDLCWICQQNSVAIMRAANRPDEEKSEVCNLWINNAL